jgi:hypothetical protein
VAAGKLYLHAASRLLATCLREHELAGLEISDVFEPDGKARKRISSAFSSTAATHPPSKK